MLTDKARRKLAAVCTCFVFTALDKTVWDAANAAMKISSGTNKAITTLETTEGH